MRAPGDTAKQSLLRRPILPGWVAAGSVGYVTAVSRATKRAESLKTVYLWLRGKALVELWRLGLQGLCRGEFIPSPVCYIYRDWSRSGTKPCNPKNQIWDNPEKKWYSSQSGCGIKTGINTTFLARNCGSALTAQPRSTTEPGVLGAWTILRDIGTSARKRRVVESTP